MSRFFQEQKKTDTPNQSEVRRAKDFWSGIFGDSIIAQIDESSTVHNNAADVVRFAGEIADTALSEMEKRWPKI